ncbi:cartilage intermediate layer protein 1-like [Glandiceps talaboti]
MTDMENLLTNGQASQCKSFPHPCQKPPVVTEHPQSKLRNIGEDVALCCEAQGVPPPSYEWFKDDVIVSSENYVGNSLLLSDLKLSHSGRYMCRANNVAGAQYSLAATLTVLDSSSASCDTSPLQQMTKLPDGCTDGSGSNYYDIGKCSRRICHGGLSNTTQCTDEQTYCCSPTSSVFHTVQCDSFEIKLKVVTGCGCNVCGKQTITIQGKAVGVDQGYPLTNGYIHIGNDEVGRTTANGEFSFEIGRGRKQLALTFTDKWDYFAETVKIIPLNDESSRFYHVVLLSKKAEAVTLSGNQSSVIFMGNKTEGEVKVELEIPEQSFHAEDGSLYTDEVKASVTFYDPADPSAADVMPSDLSTRDIEGNQQALRTYGMFSTQFKDKDDNPLRVDKPMQLVIDPVEAGIDLNDIDADGKPRVRLWALNKLSGEWEDSGELQVVKAKRRKRDIEDFLIGTVTVTGYHVWIFNLDTMEDRLHTCYLKVRTYKTKHMEETVQNAEVTAVTADPTNSISGGVLYYYQKGTTSNDGSVCLKTFCDRSGDLFQIHISVKYGDETFTPYHPSEVPDSKHPAAWPQDLQDSFSVLGGNASFSSMKGITPRMATDEYDYNWAYSDSDYDRIVDQDLGPLYWQWYYEWVAEYRCWEADTTENFVVLTGPERGLEEYTAHPYGYDWQRDEETLRTTLSWYPHEGTLKRVCFIKLSVGGTKTGRFKVSSHGGELDIVLGELFGYRIDDSKKANSVSSAACIEFKCSGPIREGNPFGNFPPSAPVSGVTLGTDKTILKIKPADPNCQLTSGSGGINQGLSDYFTLTGVNDIVDSEVTFQVPEGDSNGPSTGLYSFRGTRNSGYSNALTNCHVGDDDAYSLPVQDQIDNPDQGWAFHFDCT